MDIYTEEPSGLIAPVIPFDTEEEVITPQRHHLRPRLYLYTTDITRATLISEGPPVRHHRHQRHQPPAAAAPFAAPSTAASAAKAAPRHRRNTSTPKLIGLSLG